jgi:hypothetical protein
MSVKLRAAPAATATGGSAISNNQIPMIRIASGLFMMSGSRMIFSAVLIVSE